MEVFYEIESIGSIILATTCCTIILIGAILGVAEVGARLTIKYKG